MENGLSPELNGRIGAYRELLIGCGSNRQKKAIHGGSLEWKNLTTLDHLARHHPDVIWDLETLPLPFPDDYFDEIHAYDVIEHCTGQQGDPVPFLAFFTEIHRILKPAGVFCAIVPYDLSAGAWGDISHKRVINEVTLSFLSQSEYEKQVGNSPMSDFRDIYKADFTVVTRRRDDEVFAFVLRAIK